MWLVRVALTRPYTFVVLALMLVIVGTLSILRTPTDIFPAIKIPIVSVVWSYTGLPPDDMANRITSIFERAVTTTVNDIEHIESESLNGVSVTKLFFHQSADIAVALSQATAIAQTMLKQLPPGTTPPLVLSYDATTVPVMQLLLSSTTLPEQILNDLGNNFIRTQLAVVQGAALPYPYGGKVRQIQVDLNQQAMQTYAVSPQVVNAAVLEQNLILPAGTEKIGMYEYLVKLNASPNTIAGLNEMPLQKIPGGVLYIHNVAHVRDGFAPQTNIVTVNGERAVMMSVQKSGNASTLNIINRIKALLPQVHDMMPAALKLGIFGDQSVFVTASIEGVVREGVIAAALTGLMILLVLGSWRSTVIIVVSIPLSILASLSMLSALGETINIMTLGGLALAVGILVDDATVAIENINWNIEQGKPVTQSILDGAEQIAIPALVSTLCICIVFLPMFFLGGVAQYLFSPLALAVIFAMMASYFLSRTLVATMADYLLQNAHSAEMTEEKQGWFTRIHKRVEYRFEQLRRNYFLALNRALHARKAFLLLFAGFVAVSFLLLAPWIGSDFFPSVDAGQIKLHMRAPAGTRVEETARMASDVNALIRKIIPPEQIDTIVNNIGLPVSGINLSYNNSATIGPGDADILIDLQPEHTAVNDIVRELRHSLRVNFPAISFSFLPADIVNQTLSLGLPSPIDIQISGLNIEANRRFSENMLEEIKRISGIVDARIKQDFNYPTFKVNVDRARAIELGITQRDVATSLLVALSGSFQTTPTFWVNPGNDVSYSIVSQTPQYVMNSLNALRNVPITGLANDTEPQILGAIADVKREMTPADVTHYNVQPTIDIFAAVQDRDLGSVSKDIRKLLARLDKDKPKGSTVRLNGIVATQEAAFSGLYFGLLFSIVLVYLLMVINFQSWLDPFIIITALPAALAGIVWMLFLTGTNLSVPALTGAIMCMGVATSNAILVVSFARQHLKEGHSALQSALQAGYNRLRPVLMTATAMIIGMLPMSLGLGEGGEQNAPLGRAVIGGLSFATVATLFFVPTVFCMIHGRRKKHPGKESMGDA